MEKLIENVKENPIKTVDELNKKNFNKLLSYLSENYYEKGNSLISDELFDIINEHYENKFNESPSNDKDKKKKVKLPYYLGSQSKIKSSINEINNWTKKYSGPYVISNKIDGMSALIVKKNDEIKLFTRGTKGFYGHDITRHLPYLNIDLTHLKNDDAIRGELMISKVNFENHLASIRKTERNAVSGFINKDNSAKKYLKLIDFIGFSVIHPLMKQKEQFDYIKKLKIKTPKHTIQKKLDIEFLSDYLVENKKNYEYEIDGLVIVDNSQIYSLIEGENPKYSFSFKSYLTEEKAETTIIDIEWNITKTGKIYPTLIVDEVEIDNIKINRCTGNNAKFIVNNSINVGTKILITRSNDVIPKVDKIIKASPKPGLPKNIKYEWDKTKTNIISIDRNEEQEKQYYIKQIYNTVSVLGIEFLGEGNIKKFVDNGYCSFFEIIKMENKKKMLYNIEGFSEKIVEKIYSSINEKLSIVNLENLLISSNYFDGLGIRKIKMITNIYSNILDLYEKKGDKIYEDIMNIHGYDKITTQKFVDGMKNFIKWFHELKKLKPNIQIKQKIINNKKQNNQEYQNKKIVFSGIRNKEMENKLEMLGAKISSSISKNTDLLIVKNKNDISSKINKAKDLNIKIMNIDEMEEKLI